MEDLLELLAHLLLTCGDAILPPIVEAIVREDSTDSAAQSTSIVDTVL
jgi:hypothetical protein